MSKFIALIILTIFISKTMFPVEIKASSVDEVNDFTSYVNSFEQKLTRFDCIIFITFAISGRTNTLTEPYGGTDDVSNMVICDSLDEIMGSGAYEAFFEKFYYRDKCIFPSRELNQLEVIVKNTKVVYGEYTCGPSNEYVYFNFFRNVTLDEATAFMVRCLKPDGVDLKDLTSTFIAAKNIGLVLESDQFYDDPKHELTLDEFKVILHRFLKKPRGVFHDPKSFADYSSYTYDSEHTKTYYDTLSERYTDEYIDSLLSYDGSEEIGWADNYIKDSFWDKIPEY